MLLNPRERLAFFLNFFTTASLHACIELLEEKTIEVSLLKTSCYEIGHRETKDAAKDKEKDKGDKDKDKQTAALQFSLLDLEHRVLRAACPASDQNSSGLKRAILGNTAFKVRAPLCVVTLSLTIGDGCAGSLCDRELGPAPQLRAVLGRTIRTTTACVLR